MHLNLPMEAGLADISRTVKVFNQPFAYTIYNQQVDYYCSYCLQRLVGKAENLCGNCHFRRYCDKTCQRQAWKSHKQECGRLVKSFPNLPMTQILFLAQIVDKTRFIKANGDVFEWQKERKFDDLMGHEEDILNDSVKMQDYDKVSGKLKAFMLDETPEREELFPIYCRTWINSHTIHNNVGTELGMCLDLGVSYYNHSCRPNAALVFDGYRAMIRPLAAGVDANDWNKTFISYVDIGRSKYRRQKDLWNNWYFHCQCERCLDPEDDRLTTMKCVNTDCKNPVVVTETCKIEDIVCMACGSVNPAARVKQAQDMMLDLPTKFQPQATDSQLTELKKKLEEISQLLHPENIYYCRMLTAFIQLAGSDPMVSDPELHKMVYQNYAKCFPAADRHLGYQLLHIVRTLLESGRRHEATPYAFEAMQIFEVSFGLEHPYYLQTLALWTYLDTGANKTTDELLKMLHFNYSKPVDIASVLKQAEDQGIIKPKA